MLCMCIICYPTIWYALIYKLLRNWRAKIVVTFHGSDVHLHRQPGWLYRFAAKFVDHHVFVSEGLRDDYFKSVDNDQQSILSAGILDIYQQPGERVEKQFDLLIVGALTQIKGLGSFIGLT